MTLCGAGGQTEQALVWAVPAGGCGTALAGPPALISAPAICIPWAPDHLCQRPLSHRHAEVVRKWPL